MLLIFLITSFNNNRPPDYPPTLPPAPSLPHHSSQAWHPSSQSFSSPGHSTPGSAIHHDYYSPTSATSSSSSFQPTIPTSMTTHERNNNEPSMVSPSRYTTTSSSSGVGVSSLHSAGDSMPQGVFLSGNHTHENNSFIHEIY